MKLIREVSLKWKRLRKFQSSTFDTIARRKLVEDQNTILELSGRIPELQNRNKLYEWFKGVSGCWINSQWKFPRYQSTSVIPTSSNFWRIAQPPCMVNMEWRLEFGLCTEDNTHSWVRISHGSNKFVMDSTNNDRSSWRSARRTCVTTGCKKILHADHRQKQNHKEENLLTLHLEPFRWCKEKISHTGTFYVKWLRRKRQLQHERWDQVWDQLQQVE